MVEPKFAYQFFQIIIPKNMSRLTSTTRQTQIITWLEQKPATFAEIDSYLHKYAVAHDLDMLFSERTLQRDIKEIATLFDREIKFDRRIKRYAITKDEINETKNKMLFNAYQYVALLKLNDNLKEYIEFDNSPKQGTEHFQFVLNAIQYTHQIKISYKKFDSNDVKVHTCEPYLLKQYQNRWYLIAKDINSKYDSIINFALDRIHFVEVLKIKFDKNNRLEAKDNFKHCFGIFAPNANKPTKTVLSFLKSQKPYLLSMPLHNSQTIISETEENICIGLQVYITYDFIRHILSYGDEIEVIQPKKLANQIKGIYTDAFGLY